MNCRYLLVLFFLLVLCGCAAKALPPVTFPTPAEKIDYLEKVKPILVKRCVVCHSCYNSPCQLKLSSYEGLARGATKKAVYNATRLHTMEPTRLFMDAHSVPEWRQKGFHSVSENSAGCNQNNSLMMQLLDQKRRISMRDGDTFYPEAEDLTCAESREELGAYLEKHPNRGMPFGFPPLEKDEFETIAGWLMQGAEGPTPEEQAKLVAPSAPTREKIAKWEDFLNHDDPKYAMTARYLYEHLFLAHIKFDTPENEFYELVRSRTPSDQDIQVIATDRPYDDPKEQKFYYRFRKIHSTIVHKTHMVFDLSDAQFQRIQDLFIAPEWLLPPQRFGYDAKDAGNPFKVFEQIPPKSRYQFLLDNIHYIIMTFIRGPVCKGQIALDVVHDHFWLIFLDPAYDLSVQDPGFLMTYGDLLEMPAMQESTWGLAKATLHREYRQKSSAFARKRQEYYASHYRYKEPDEKAIWLGDKATDSPLLTVFRHFDSASVHSGPLGNLPETIWVMDYPLVERIYYSLVAGFNVYGDALHQFSTRVYMDELRQEGETYFIDFMPKNRRHDIMKEWYGGMDLERKKINYTPSALKAGFAFSGHEPKREFIEFLVDHRFHPDTARRFDKNYLRAGEGYPALPEAYHTIDDYIQGFKAVSKPGVSFFTKVKDHNANLAYVRIKVTAQEKDDVYVSMVINRFHDDVTTLFGEELRLRPELDNATFIEGFVGSYPNYFFEVDLADLPDFLAMLRDFDGCPAAMERLDRYGVNRANPKFWEVYDRFQKAFDATDPVQAGLFDLNRYFYLARTKE